MEDTKIVDVLEDAPINWGRWGEEDEIGALNFLTQDEVLRGIGAVERGEIHSLGLPVTRASGDPVFPSRSPAQHFMDLDKGHYDSGKQISRDGQEAADDVVFMPLHGTTHIDALGHAWYDDKLYNGYDAQSTKGGLDRCSIKPIADHGILGRGVLVDIARYRGVDALEHGARITLDEIQDAASDQAVDIQQRDILVLRTGFLEQYYDDGPEALFGEKFREPGVTYSDSLVEWFHEMEFPVFATDTLSNEQTVSDVTNTFTPLHAALLRDQGVIFNEMVKLDELAADCASGDDQTFLYIAAPLKVARGTGSPVNPLAIR